MKCPKCGKEVKKNATFCGMCGAKLEYEQDRALKVKKKGKIIPGLVILGFVCIVGISSALFIKNKSIDKNDEYCVWIADGKYQLTKNPTNKKTNISEFDTFFIDDAIKNDYSTTELGGWVTVSKDQKYLYYMNDLYHDDNRNDNFGNLYRLDLRKIKKDLETNENNIIEVDTDVYLGYSGTLEAYGDSGVTYQKANSEEDGEYKSLYYYNGESGRLVDDNIVNETICEDTLIYTRWVDDNTSLYAQVLDDGKTVKIASNVSDLGIKDKHHIAFVRNEGLYIAGIDEEPRRVADHVWAMQMNQENAEGIMFFQKENEDYDYTDFVNYEQYDEDANISEPDYGDEKYKTTKTETDWWGDEYTVEGVDEEAYQEDLLVYTQAQERMAVYNALKESSVSVLKESSIIDTSDITLYFYSLKNEEIYKMADNMVMVEADDEWVWGVSPNKSALKIEINDIMAYLHAQQITTDEYGFYAEKYINEHFSSLLDLDNLYFFWENGNVYKISKDMIAGSIATDIEDINAMTFNHGKNIAFMFQMESGRNVYIADVSDEQLKNFHKLSIDDVATIGVWNEKLKICTDRITYLCDGENTWKYLENNEDIIYGSYYEDGVTAFFSTYDSTYGGTLWLADASGKSSKLEDDVTDFIRCKDGKLFILSNDNLKMYDGSTFTSLQRDVKLFYCSNEDTNVVR